jgi:hypothetical protein
MKRYPGLFCILFCTWTYSFSQVLTDSNLPVVIINTDNSVAIPDSPRVLASMKIIYRGEGLRNYLTDQDNPGYLDYNGRISIEIRGSSSQVLPKKQYGLTTLKADNISNNNVSLLGMPEDNDWILNGLGFEPSLIRDYLNYNLSRMIGEYASRTVYCEVVINGSYNGLYLLEEKIKQGSERVNITKIGKLDNAFPKLSGGYITKADKLTGGDRAAWIMPSYLGSAFDVSFIHDLPKPDDVTGLQNDYIRSEFDKLASTASLHNASPETGYPSVIDVPSFVDHMILEELGSNSDAYQYSAFFHKDRNGKLRAGPIWDLNLTFGYDLSIWGLDRSKTNVWQFSNGDNEGPKFWRDLYNDPEFKCSLLRRWNQLTRPGQPLNYYSIEALIDKAVATISEASVRENTRWGTVPNLQYEISKIKDFLKIRIPWMTAEIGAAAKCTNVITPPLVITKIMYHPDSTLNFPDRDQQEFLEIMNTGSQAVSLTGVYFSGTGFVYQFPPSSEIAPHSTKMLAGNSDVFIRKYGVSPFGQFTRNLSNKSEKLVLADGFGNVIDSLTYSDQPPWPDADGNGYYLELMDPLSDNSIATNWTASMNTLVSAKEAEMNPGFKMYPSPVRHNLTIESSETILVVEFFNSQGRLLRRIDVNSTTYLHDMSSFPTGIYMIKVITKGRIIVQKVVKE